MEQWAFIFLQNRCTGCGTCIMACKAWNHLRRSDAAVYPLDRIGSIPPIWQKRMMPGALCRRTGGK